MTYTITKTNRNSISAASQEMTSHEQLVREVYKASGTHLHSRISHGPEKGRSGAVGVKGHFSLGHSVKGFIPPLRTLKCSFIFPCFYLVSGSL